MPRRADEAATEGKVVSSKRPGSWQPFVLVPLASKATPNFVGSCVRISPGRHGKWVPPFLRIMAYAFSRNHSTTASGSRSYRNPATAKLLSGSTIMNPPALSILSLFLDFTALYPAFRAALRACESVVLMIPIPFGSLCVVVVPKSSLVGSLSSNLEPGGTAALGCG